MRVLAYILLAVFAVLTALYFLSRWATRTPLAAERFALDLTTPQGALRVYQAAVVARDLDRMVAVKDFEYEARQMLRGKGQGVDGDPEVTALTASTLKAAFRAEWQRRGWPDLSGSVTYYSEALPLDSTTVRVVELLQLPSGAKERSVVKVVRRDSEWAGRPCSLR
jgi:hypothetical protein